VRQAGAGIPETLDVVVCCELIFHQSGATLLTVTALTDLENQEVFWSPSAFVAF
jgi:hypothetical protein